MAVTVSTFPCACCEGSSHHSSHTSSETMSSDTSSDTTSSDTTTPSESSSSEVGVCGFTFEARLDWSNNADLDLYVKNVTDNEVAYWGNVGGTTTLTQNWDAHPTCDTVPNPPELITGTFGATHQFQVWYNQYSSCEVSTSPTVTRITIVNTGTSTITVNGTSVSPGGTWVTNTMAYAGYATLNQGGYSGGTPINVVCVGGP